jgi:hypothetical protein
MENNFSLFFKKSTVYLKRCIASRLLMSPFSKWTDHMLNHELTNVPRSCHSNNSVLFAPNYLNFPSRVGEKSSLFGP